MKIKNFIDRTVFDDMLAQIPTARGDAYQDLATIYGDMSRLTVAWIASTPPEELQKMYNELGWKGSANVRAMHEAAKLWFQLHDPERLPRGT